MLELRPLLPDDFEDLYAVASDPLIWEQQPNSDWGGAYNGEMKRLMLSHAFKFVDNVIFSVGANNLRSQRAVEKIGGIRVSTKTDPHGCESFIFRITRPAG